MKVFEEHHVFWLNIRIFRILRLKDSERSEIAAPFLCKRCGFATVVLKRIEEHVCIKKNNSISDLERDIKVAQMGVRSRCKDAMAVLERIPNPQSIRLPKFCILESEPSIEMYRLISSSISLHHSLPKVMRSSCCSNDEKVQKCSENNSSSKQIVKTDLPYTESEMISHYNLTYDKCLERDSSSIDSLKLFPLKLKVFITVRNEFENL
ncbi:hypothetical protein DINM_005437 [Dirofilaria immitis]|nr:hypothetical protein [Dirofilaria immitis]